MTTQPPPPNRRERRRKERAELARKGAPGARRGTNGPSPAHEDPDTIGDPTAIMRRVEQSRDAIGELDDPAQLGDALDQVEEDRTGPGQGEQDRELLLHRIEIRRASARQHWRDTVTDEFEDAPQTGMRDHPAVIRWLQAHIDHAYADANLSIRGSSSLVLVGGPGAGKTHTAWWLIGHLAKAGVLTDWVVVTAPDLFGNIRPGARDPEGAIRRYAATQLLVIDDAGMPQATPFTREVEYRIINERYERHRPVIITTNLAPGRTKHTPMGMVTLADQLDERVYSRLGQMLRPSRDNVINLGVTDRRDEGQGQ